MNMSFSPLFSVWYRIRNTSESHEECVWGNSLITPGYFVVLLIPSFSRWKHTQRRWLCNLFSVSVIDRCESLMLPETRHTSFLSLSRAADAFIPSVSLSVIGWVLPELNRSGVADPDASGLWSKEAVSAGRSPWETLQTCCGSSFPPWNKE